LKNKIGKLGKCKHDSHSRKAITPIIATVLLLGFAVALGTSVFLWQARQTESLSKGLMRFASGVLECDNVNFNVQAENGCTNTNIKNSGFFNIDGFVVRSFSKFGAGSKVREVFVKAQKSDVLKLGLVSADKIEVIPVVKVKGELVGCKDKIRESGCDGLDDVQAEACNTADNKGTCSLLAGSGIVGCEECCKYSKKCCGC